MLYDFRYALRSLSATPTFTAVVLLTIALGIGANTAIFSVVNAVLLRPLPYPNAERLVRVARGSSWLDMRDWASQARTVDAVAGYRVQLFDYDTGDGAERIDGALVTGRLFELLGASALMGRPIDDRDEAPGTRHMVVVSERFWRTRLGADPRVVGRRLPFNGAQYEVIGVAAGAFQLPGTPADVFAPMYAEASQEADARSAHTMIGLLRLKPLTTVPSAQADMDGVASRLAATYPQTNRGIRYRLVPLAQSLVGNMRSALFILVATVGFVLLIACVNVASLLIARAAARRSELAVRAALGAGRWRLARQLLVESLVLALSGGALGLVIGWLLTRAVVALAPASLSRLDAVSLDDRVLLFTLAISIATGLVFGVLPSWIAGRGALADAIRAARGGSSRRRLRSALLVVEFALALVLVSSAGVLLRSFHALTAQPLGFAADHLLTGNIKFGGGPYRDIAARTRFFDRLGERLAATAGVTAVGFVTELPIGGSPLMHNLSFQGRSFAVGAEPEVFYRGVSAGYFGALGLPIVSGRAFTAADTATSPLVAVANESFARTYYPGQDVIGQHVRWTSGTADWTTIVGLVPDVRGVSLDQAEVPALYVPYAQERNWWRMWMDVVVRTTSDPASVTGELRRAVASVDRNVPIARVRTMDEVVRASLGDERFSLFLVGAFAAVALLLAAAGTYGVMAYLVEQRFRELGIRLAIGARPSDVMRLVLRDGVVLACVGCAAGLGLWWWASRWLQTLLFAVSPADPVTLALSAGVLIAVTLLACYAPARRASRVDPVLVLRSE
jgi:putative ABC transport system permease protein